ncbi:hypothetical protein EJ04DRAFT_513855 [Polyplosphaeria fusca]|uniref:DUF676 domain-containing protein n=1 Tax=Polyplosphaeria fusca TaxID=682080 RepID=A0A9P4QWZ5_9PLEO|nr:hypothetical protein EJ04DRAFT_513855 [Polyplosphaeria fusca]
MSKIFGKGSKRSAVEDSTSNGEGSSDATTAHPEVDTSVSTTSNTPGTYIALNGLTVLTGEEEKSVDVVIVHGLNGSPDTTWTHANGFYWPKVLGQKVSNARVMVYGYNVKIEPTIGTNNIRIKSVADDLLNEVKQQRRKDPARRRPLVFIGHSLGGLVIKRALDRASRKTDDPLHFIYTSTKLALFFGTPNAGSQLTAMWRIRFLERLGKAAATEVPPNIKAALEMHSIELLDLADDFLDIDSIRRRELKIFSFFEELNYPGLGERVVDETSARLHVPDETYLGINANHVTMVKFENENNKTFKTVCGEVEDVADAADAGKPELQRSSSSG